MIQKILAVIGALAIIAGALFVGFVGGVRTSNEMNAFEANTVASVEQGINQAQSGINTQSGLAATDWERVCKGLEAYVYDTGRMPKQNPCGPDAIFVIDARWNDGDTNDGQFYVTMDYSNVLQSEQVWPNGSYWVTDTVDYVAKSMGDWCSGKAPKIIENTSSWTSCGGDFVYVVVDAWNLSGETNVGMKKTFSSIEDAVNWLDYNGLDHGSIWVELEGYSK